MQNSKKIVIGVCGRIGSGKSVVRHLLEVLYGIPTYDCDARAKQMYYLTDVRKQVAALIGTDPIDSEQQLKRELLAEMMRVPKQRKALEAIIHTAVQHDFEQWHSRMAPLTQAVAIESAILYTSGMYLLCDSVIAVEASVETRLQRVLARDASSRGEQRFWEIERLQEEESRRQKAEAPFSITNEGHHSIIRATEEICHQLLGGVSIN